MAYTAAGGRALLIETTKFPGNGQITLTGQLGDVMKESIGTGLSWIKSNAFKLGLVSEPAVRVIKNSDD
jgi:ATP-dependent Lon protease